MRVDGRAFRPPTALPATPARRHDIGSCHLRAWSSGFGPPRATCANERLAVRWPKSLWTKWIKFTSLVPILGRRDGLRAERADDSRALLRNPGPTRTSRPTDLRFTRTNRDAVKYSSRAAVTQRFVSGATVS
jgi:hypothetical protein